MMEPIKTRAGTELPRDEGAFGRSVRGTVLLVLAGLGLAGLVPAAHAERADRQRPINVESDRMTADDLNQVAIFSGRVVVVQGTFVLCADQVTMRQDKAGNQNALAIGTPATFREKRDGVDEWIEGEAARIEYDTRSETLELFDRARVTREKDEVRGNFISWNSRTEVVRVQDQREPTTATTTREGRVSAVFQPRAQAPQATEGRAQQAPAPTRAPLTLQSASEPGRTNTGATSTAGAPVAPGCRAPVGR
jgi:lipopolysaccharide export system protein LptA